MSQKYIKEITPKDNPFTLKFQIIKKVTEQEGAVIYQISDETGTCKLKIKSEITKFIEEGKVYSGHNLVPVLNHQKIVLELALNIGSLTKQPIVLPFKDHTYDLSEVEWKEPKQVIKKETSSIQTKPAESQTSQSVFSSSSKFQSNSKSDNYNKSSYRNNKTTQERPKYIEKQDKQYKQDKYQKQDRSHYHQKDRKFTSKPSFIRIQNLSSFEPGQVVDVLVYISQIKNIQIQSSGKWKRYTECKLSDVSGSASGLFAENIYIQKGKYYEFRNLKLKINNSRIKLVDTENTSVKVNNSVDFKPNTWYIKAYDNKY